MSQARNRHRRHVRAVPGLGYAGLPVAFALIAAVVVVAALFTDLTIGSLMGQLFNGINELALLAIPFFLLVGELMTSARITPRLIALTQAMVGHLRSGLAQVVAVSCMIFGGISGSSTADTVAIGTVLMPAMREEGYTPGVLRGADRRRRVDRLDGAAVDHGDRLWRGGRRLGRRAVPRRRRARAHGLHRADDLQLLLRRARPARSAARRIFEFGVALRGAILPLMIPVIIIGSILGGVITPAEAGMAAVVYALVVLLPLMNRGPFPPAAEGLRDGGGAVLDPADGRGERLRLRLDARLSGRRRHHHGLGAARWAPPIPAPSCSSSPCCS